MTINDLLKIAIDHDASDLHLKSGNPPILRIDGELRPLHEMSRLMDDDTMNMALSMMNARQQQRFKDQLEIDVSYSVPDLGRFRVAVFQQRGSVSLAARIIPSKILTLRELTLPPVLESICEERRGLVICTGTTGSGKSTTLASMVNHINNSRYEHIITVEDPIEYVHTDRKGLISQREIDVDTHNFSGALRSALRQDPDVVLVGEMRDLETMETAIMAAETGHLVFSTLHTLDATETITRLISVFPPEQQQQIRIQLAQVLKAVISLRLLPRANGNGRVPAVEVLINTPYVRECIEQKEKTRFLRDQMARGTSQYGMQTFDQSLFFLYRADLITLEEALLRASNKDEFRMRLEGVQFSADEALEEMEGRIEMPDEILIDSSQFGDR